MKIIIKAQKEEKIKVKGLENEIHVDVNELIKNDKKKKMIKNSGLAPNSIGNPENPK